MRPRVLLSGAVLPPKKMALVICGSWHNDVRSFDDPSNQKGQVRCYQKKCDPAPDDGLLAGVVDCFILTNVQATEAIVAQLDLTPVEGSYGKRGSQHAPVDVLLRIALYNILNGCTSPASWARNLQSCAATRYVARGCRPSRAALYRFRDKTKVFIDELFKQVLALAKRDGVLEGDEISVDGTMIDALASRHRLVNEKTLCKRLGLLEEFVARPTLDSVAPTQPSPLPRWMAKTDRGKLTQLDRFHQAKAVLTERLAKNAKKKGRERLKESRVFVSTFDPAVTISRNKLGVFGPLWPTQFVSHVESRLIVALDVFTVASDSNTIGKMIDLARLNCGTNFQRVYADAGYTSLSDIRSCLQRSISLVAPVATNSFTDQNKREKIEQSGKEPLFNKSDFRFDYEANRCTCPSGRSLTAFKDGKRVLPNGEELRCYRFNYTPDVCKDCPIVANCKENAEKTRSVRLIQGEEVLAKHKELMTPEVLSHCRSIRAQTAEKSFADGKQRVGLRRIACRTLTRAKAIITLHILALNIKTLFGLQQANKKPG